MRITFKIYLMIYLGTSQNHAKMTLVKTAPGSSSKTPTKQGLSILFVLLREQDRNLSTGARQPSRGDPDAAEANEVARGSRTAVVTNGNGAAVGIGAPATAA